MSSNNGTHAVRVLLADDAPDIRMLLRLTLEKDGRFEIVGEARDGKEAVELAGDTHPDAIVLDLAMPVMDGLQALPEIRRFVPIAKIVVLSGFNASNIADEAISLGADAYLEKGAAFNRLVALLLEARPDPQDASDVLESSATRPEAPAEPGQKDQEALIAEAQAAVAEASDLSTGFDRISQIASEAICFDRASFWVETGQSETFECAATSDQHPLRLPPGAKLTLTGRARQVLDGRPVVEPDTSADAADETNGTLHKHGIKSYTCVPLNLAGGTKAFIGFASERPQAFSLEDVPFLERLVKEVASTLHLLFLLDRERNAGTQLREADKLKNDLVGIVAHDLRSPMSVISGYASFMKDSWATLEEDQKLEFLETISRNVNDVSRLVGDMAEVASFESGQLKCEIEPFDLAEVVRSTVAEIAIANLGRACTMTIPDELPRVYGDVQRQRQILANLISNAIKFSHSPNPVEVVVDVEEGSAQISVRDHGVGIDAEHLAHIFDKFYRVTGNGKTKVAGTGLGLYICKILVEAQGGKIWADSLLGVGSTFTYSVSVDHPHA